MIFFLKSCPTFETEWTFDNFIRECCTYWTDDPQNFMAIASDFQAQVDECETSYKARGNYFFQFVSQKNLVG